ncbi:DUF6903 family protein [Alloscardovia macacae]|uniref:Uncharacterized protein n=1 Tax=Alloscardovia macacae TaxID=1160091 RepID=A0A261F5E9_9BIFI|nr:hypothetical protein [Alloscardovia macacae]OZG54342.1 hypothetical protein ALMA_0803 [Alloscardovia macacae]
MSEKIRAALSIGFQCVLYIACIVLTIFGAAHTGWVYLGLEFVGLLGIISIIWFYNWRNR